MEWIATDSGMEGSLGQRYARDNFKKVTYSHFYEEFLLHINSQISLIGSIPMKHKNPGHFSLFQNGNGLRRSAFLICLHFYLKVGLDSSPWVMGL